MAAPPPNPSASDTVARTNEFEITTAPRGQFQKVNLRGRFTDELLTILQKQVFLQLRDLAIDCSALSGITMSFARSLYYASQAMRSQSHFIVLVNPPESMRGFLKLIGAEGRIPILLSEAQLPEKAADVLSVARNLERDLFQVKRELEANMLWQFTDREFCWICPFCAELRDDIRIASRVSIGMQAQERVWRHLNFECRRYAPANPRYYSKEELEAKVRQVNLEKMASSKKSVEALKTKVLKLEEKALWAEHMEKGVKIAASRQRKLLPTKAPQIPGCEISFTYRPAEALCGDFYDFLELGGGRAAFVIGDVSGHGIEAGILMGMTKKVLSIRLSETGDPAAALRQANRDIIKDLDRSSFVTAAAVLYDPATRTLGCARAGHNPPILYNPARGSTPRRFEGGGLMLGMAQPNVFDAQLVSEVIEVMPGDVLLLYTDGLEEGKNASGEDFGTGRIIPVLQSECEKPGAYILGALFYEFDRFAGSVEQEDDLTALCVKFK